METTEVAYTAAGLELVGTLALPDPADGPLPGVLIAHEAGGLDRCQRGRAVEFAREGFAAFALDYHGAHAPFASLDAMAARREDLLGDAGQVRALTGAALDVLRSHHAVDASRLAAVGYCLGGALVLELARTSADLRAVVGIHPSLHAMTPAGTPQIKGEVLVHVASDDPFVPPQQRTALEAEMSDAGVAVLWRAFGSSTGLSHREFLQYFEGLDTGAALTLTAAEPFGQQIPLAELRAEPRGFRPPQSFAYVDAATGARLLRVAV